MIRYRRIVVSICGLLAGGLALARPAQAHSGPPFPIASNQIAGPYSVSVWTDPDTTDDRSAAGRFWVTLYPAHEGVALPSETRASVSIEPADRAGSPLTTRAEVLDNDVSRQYAALLMDHEGRFHTHIAIEGPLGPATLDADVDATYDLRPPPLLMILYVMPFALAGFLWIKLLLRRRTLRARPKRDAAS